MLIEFEIGRDHNQIISINPDEVSSIDIVIEQHWHNDSIVIINMKNSDRYRFYPKMTGDDVPNHTTSAYIDLRSNRTMELYEKMRDKINKNCSK